MSEIAKHHPTQLAFGTASAIKAKILLRRL
jgi:hypothetical protein